MSRPRGPGASEAAPGGVSRAARNRDSGGSAISLKAALREGLDHRWWPVSHLEQCVYVTTSWDDGHVLDHEVARRLAARDLPGTFYVAPGNVELPESERLGEAGIAELAEAFEIGGHTLTHLRLPSLPAALAEAEIRDGKAALEDITGRELVSFCYPCGAYRPEHVAMVRDAGFRVGRTVRRYSNVVGDPLQMPTTMHCYRHLVDVIPAFQAAGRRLPPARGLYRDWERMAIALFDTVLETGGVFHLWGHSWELDGRRDWERLDRVLDYIAGRSDVRYVANGELGAIAPESAA